MPLVQMITDYSSALLSTLYSTERGTVSEGDLYFNEVISPLDEVVSLCLSGKRGLLPSQALFDQRVAFLQERMGLELNMLPTFTEALKHSDAWDDFENYLLEHDSSWYIFGDFERTTVVGHLLYTKQEDFQNESAFRAFLQNMLAVDKSIGSLILYVDGVAHILYTPYITTLADGEDYYTLSPDAWEEYAASAGGYVG